VKKGGLPGKKKKGKKSVTGQLLRLIQIECSRTPMGGPRKGESQEIAGNN